MRRVGDRWLVASWERGRVNSNRMDVASPWSVGQDLAVVEKPHVLLVGERRNRRFNTRLASRLEAAVADVRALWPKDLWDGKVVAVAMTEPDFLDTFFTPGEASPGGHETDHFWADRREGTEGTGRGTGMRLVLATDFLFVDTAQMRSSLRDVLTFRAFIEGERGLARLLVAARDAGGGDVGVRTVLREVLGTDEKGFRRDVARFAEDLVRSS
jgi:hypothetical protein